MIPKFILNEIDALTPQINQTDIEAPSEIKIAIAARQRQILRNTAVQMNIQLQLAKKRHAEGEIKEINQVFDKIIQDITELDSLFPEAKNQMNIFDTKAIAEGRL